MLRLSLGLCALLWAAPILADLPIITLPWGKWQAEIDDKDPQLYVFRNVRFAAEPERFGPSAFPTWTDDSLQTPEDVSCLAVDITKLKNPPGGHAPLSDPSQTPQSEDCLFLDIYAPVAALVPGGRKLPVIVWIYGGAYSLGSKTDSAVLYSGRPIIRASNYNAIFVVGNYRTGALGFLAGDYMQRAGLPNAGFHDQALLLEWVQEYIDQAGGDRSQVSAWGESAGAGSILFHLVREGGARDPLFRTFYAMSPAFELSWDNEPDGRLDSYYRMFSELAGCGFEYEIECLRGKETGELARANQQLFDKIRQTGLFPVGPAVDGKWVTSLPSLSLSQGKYWPDIKAAIISHCSNESAIFVPKGIDGEAEFDAFLVTFLPGEALAPQRAAIKEFYDCPNTHQGNFSACLGTIIRDAVFTCNTRYLFEAYPDKSYMMEYAFPSRVNGVHGSDLIPLFTSTIAEAVQLLIKLGIDPVLAWGYASTLHWTVVPKFVKYLAAFAVGGDPNGAEVKPAWPIAVDGEEGVLEGVLRVQGILNPTKFKIGEDEQNTARTCGFWREIAGQLMGKPEGSVVHEEL